MLGLGAFITDLSVAYDSVFLWGFRFGVQLGKLVAFGVENRGVVTWGSKAYGMLPGPIENITKSLSINTLYIF